MHHALTWRASVRITLPQPSLKALTIYGAPVYQAFERPDREAELPTNTSELVRPPPDLVGASQPTPLLEGRIGHLAFALAEPGTSLVRGTRRAFVCH